MFKTKRFTNLDTFDAWVSNLHKDNFVIGVTSYGMVIIVLYYAEEGSGAETEPVESVPNQDVTDPGNAAVISAGQIQHPMNESSSNSMTDRREIIPTEPTPEEDYQTAYRKAIADGKSDADAKAEANDAAKKTRDRQAEAAGRSEIPNAALEAQQARAQARASELRPAIQGTGLVSVEDHKAKIQDKIDSGESILGSGDISKTQRGETGGIVTHTLPGLQVTHGGVNPYDIPAQPNSVSLVPQAIGEVGVQSPVLAPPLYPVVPAASVPDSEHAAHSQVSPLTVVGTPEALVQDPVGAQPNSVVTQPVGTSPTPDLTKINSGIQRQETEDEIRKRVTLGTPVASTEAELKKGEQRSSITQDTPKGDHQPSFPEQVVPTDPTLPPSATTPVGAPPNATFNSGMLNSTPAEGVSGTTNE